MEGIIQVMRLPKSSFLLYPKRLEHTKLIFVMQVKFSLIL